MVPGGSAVEVWGPRALGSPVQWCAGPSPRLFPALSLSRLQGRGSHSLGGLSQLTAGPSDAQWEVPVLMLLQWTGVGSVLARHSLHPKAPSGSSVALWVGAQAAWIQAPAPLGTRSVPRGQDLHLSERSPHPGAGNGGLPPIRFFRGPQESRRAEPFRGAWLSQRRPL